MKILFILNDPPYGTERCYNGTAPCQCPPEEGASRRGHGLPNGRCRLCGRKGQKTPDGYYNVERMLKRFATGNHKILLCGTCMDARGIARNGSHGWCAAQLDG